MSTLIIGCLPAKKNQDGLYEYEYCIGIKGTKNSVKIIDQNPSEICQIKGTVKDQLRQSVIWPANVNLKPVTGDKTQTTLTDSLGQFSFTVPNGDYILNTSFIGYSRLENENISVSNSIINLEINLGEADGFYTYGFTTKRKMIKWELRKKAKRLARKYKKERLKVSRK